MRNTVRKALSCGAQLQDQVQNQTLKLSGGLLMSLMKAIQVRWLS